jgi:hypothetical protein
MNSQPRKQRRPFLRREGYDDIRAGLYFMTSVTRRRGALFGEVIDGEMRLNRFGEIVEQAWLDLPRHYPNVELGEFIVRPNHFHGIIILNDSSKGGSVQTVVPRPAKTFAGQEALPAGTKPRPYRKNQVFLKACAHSNPSRHAGSTCYARNKAFPSGSAVITTISFATSRIWN